MEVLGSNRSLGEKKLVIVGSMLSMITNGTVQLAGQARNFSPSSQYELLGAFSNSEVFKRLPCSWSCEAISGSGFFF